MFGILGKIIRVYLRQCYNNSYNLCDANFLYLVFSTALQSAFFTWSGIEFQSTIALYKTFFFRKFVLGFGNLIVVALPLVL